MMINRMSDFPKKELVVADILRVTSGKNNLVVLNGKRVVFSGKVIQLNDLVHNEFPVSDQVREETLNLYV